MTTPDAANDAANAAGSPTMTTTTTPTQPPTKVEAEAEASGGGGGGGGGTMKQPNHHHHQQQQQQDDVDDDDDLPLRQTQQHQQQQQQQQLLHWFPSLDWTCSTIVGFFVVSYWRCTWIIMDLVEPCNQPSEATLVDGNSFCWFIPSYDDPELYSSRLRSARISYAVGISCLFVGIFTIWYGSWVPYGRIDLYFQQLQQQLGGQRQQQQQKIMVITPIKAITRFLTVYCLGFAAVNIWRAIWYWADYWILPSQPLYSYWLTSIVGSTTAFVLWGGNSLLAPPAIFLLDGPSLQSPPIAVTLLSSHYALVLPSGSKPPPLSLPMKIADILLSFIVLPFAVVWFWRGTWLLLDYYLWGLTLSNVDVNYSILYSFILAYGLYALMCEPVIGLIDNHFGDPDKTKTGPGCSVFYELLGRFRTYLLAWATVGFWRGVWLIWDQFLGGTTPLSAGVGHVVAIVVLTTMGCVSSICAPPSTMGVDSVPNPDAADEPLFAMLPIPYETLYLFGIGRQPQQSSVPHQDDDIGFEMPEDVSSKEATNIPRESKIRPSRIEEGIEMIGRVGRGSATDEQQAVKLEVGVTDTVEDGEGEDTVPELPTTVSPSRLQTDASAIDVTSGGGDHGGPSAISLGSPSSAGWSSTRRGWQTDGAFRSYGELQREGIQSLRSEYAQRQHPSNKRLRSKFFRSR